MIGAFDTLTRDTSLEYRLAYTADLEATFTPVFKLMLDNDSALFRPGDDRVASLFIWHFVEEVEHRSSALIIFDSVVGSDVYRMRMAPSVFKHVLDGVEPASAGFNKHVPLEERKVDALAMFARYRRLRTLRKWIPGLRPTDNGPMLRAFDVLPLYIVAIYPFMATVSFDIVRMLGVFRRHGALVGAACVGFAHHAFYEIFDHLGPQLRWWEWSTTNPINQPMFDSVPLPSVVVFAALWPMSPAFCVQWFVGRHIDQGRSFSGLELLRRTIVIGLLASAGTFILPIPATALGMGGTVIRGVVYALELVVVSVVAIVALVRQWSLLRRGNAEVPRYTSEFARWYGSVYLGVMALLWATALPDFFTAADGVTENGDPLGNLWYTLACFAVATLCLLAVFTTPERGPDENHTATSDDTATSKPG